MADSPILTPDQFRKKYGYLPANQPQGPITLTPKEFSARYGNYTPSPAIPSVPRSVAAGEQTEETMRFNPPIGKSGRIKSVEDLAAGFTKPDVIDRTNIPPSPYLQEIIDRAGATKALPEPELDSVGEPFLRGTQQAIGALGEATQILPSLLNLQPKFMRPQEHERVVSEIEADTKKASDDVKAWAERNIKARPATGKYAKPAQNFLDYLDPGRIYQTVGENAPLMAAFAGATLAHPVAGAALMLGVEGGSANEAMLEYEKRTGKRIPPIYRENVPIIIGAVNAALEKTGLENIFKVGKAAGLKRKLVKAALATIIEGSTEGAQEVTNIIAETGYGGQVPADAGRRFVESVYAGLLLGAGGSAIAALAGEPEKPKITPPATTSQTAAPLQQQIATAAPESSEGRSAPIETPSPAPAAPPEQPVVETEEQVRKTAEALRAAKEKTAAAAPEKKSEPTPAQPERAREESPSPQAAEAATGAPSTAIGGGDVATSAEAQKLETAKVFNVPLAQIKTDVDRFQNRDTDFSERTAQEVADNYDPNKFDPIVLWRDPADGSTYVLSGHSRLEGMKRRNAADIPARYFQGDERAAMNFARLEANRLGAAETFGETLKAYRAAKENQYTSKQLKSTFGSDVDFLDAVQHLNPSGDFVKILSQPAATEFPYIRRFARWIGEARETYADKFTNAHEEQLFKFLYTDDAKNRGINRDDFFKLLDKNFGKADWQADQPLTLRRGELPVTGTRARSDTREAMAEIDELRERQKVTKTVEEYQALQSEIDKKLQKVSDVVQSQPDLFADIQEDLFEFVQNSGERVRADTKGIVAQIDELRKKRKKATTPAQFREIDAEIDRLTRFKDVIVKTQRDLFADMQSDLFGFEPPEKSAKKKVVTKPAPAAKTIDLFAAAPGKPANVETKAENEPVATTPKPEQPKNILQEAAQKVVAAKASTPAIKGMTRTEFVDALRQLVLKTKLRTGEVNATIEITDAIAKRWAQWHNSTPEKFYGLFGAISTDEILSIDRGNVDSWRKGLDAQDKARISGATSFDPATGLWLIRLFEQSNFSNLIHEIGHVLRRQLPENDIRTIKSWADGPQSNQNEALSKSGEEKFARAWERYLLEGQAPNSAMREVFEKIKQLLSEIYAVVRKPGLFEVKMTDDVKKVFDGIFAEAPSGFTENVLQRAATEFMSQGALNKAITATRLGGTLPDGRKLFVKNIASRNGAQGLAKNNPNRTIVEYRDTNGAQRFAVIAGVAAAPAKLAQPAQPATATKKPVSPALTLEKYETIQSVSPSNQDAREVIPGTRRLIDSVKTAFRASVKLDNPKLTDLAEKAFRGTRVAGKFTSRDAYDALEVAVNELVAEQHPNIMREDPRQALSYLHSIINQLPRQSDRTDEQIKFQQFSTPPTEAFVAAKILNPQSGEFVLEPSAGTGDLALFAKLGGANVRTNEISPRRAGLLKMQGYDVTSVDAEALNDVLPYKEKPTAILMNPPFSSTGGRTKNNRTIYGANHITSALQRLADGGRLVAIVGRGMGFDNFQFMAWWANLAQKYNIRANILVSGEEYAKYGTDFDNRIIVIDRTGKTPGDGWAQQLANIVKTDAKNLEEVLDATNEIAKDRQKTTEGIRSNAGQRSMASDTGDVRRSIGEPARADIGRGQPIESGRSTRLNNDSRGESQSRRGDEIVSEGEPRIGVEKSGLSRRVESVGNINRVTENVRGEQLTEPTSQISAQSGEMETVAREQDTDKFTLYSPAKLNIGAKHPARIVESSSMAAVDPPDITYKSTLPPDIISQNKLSGLQLESVYYAGQRFETIMPNGQRGGFFVGDGTGVGKGRQIAGIIADQWNKGVKKILWVSASRDLMSDAQRDMDDLGLEKIPVQIINEFETGNDITLPQGVVFSTYNSLISQSQKGKGLSRQKSLENWLGPDSLIIFDEAHKAKNALAAGAMGEPTKTATAVIGIQDNLPKARVVYSSATGATDVRNMAYMTRLGLWGEGTAFPGGFMEFLSEIESGGVGAMEMVARDMKALGMYLSRSISFQGVDYSEVIHEMTPDQRKIYNTAAAAWQQVLQNIEEAIGITHAGPRQRAFAMSRFWSEHQRFFKQLMTALKVPTAIREVERAVKSDKSVVLSIIGTGEARTKDLITKSLAAGNSMDDLDFSPRETVAHLVEKSFPIESYTKEYDPATGKDVIVKRVDEQGNPVISQEALELKNQLIDSLSDLNLPENPLDQIVNYFGAKNVAEMTGRKRRLIRKPDGGLEYVKRAPDDVAMNKVNLHENKQFQDGKKNIAIISDAAATGISLHASNRAENKQRRVHITLELGWSADKQMQTFGRTHRSDQASAPEYILLSIDAGGEKRFSSTIARRLASLGALTKGQRDATGGGDLAKYNFETREGGAAVARLYGDIMRGNVEIPGIENARQTLKDMGILKNTKDGEKIEPNDETDVARFLNRVLALDVDRQNAIFDAFVQRFDGIVTTEKENGTFDDGVADITGEHINIVGNPEIVNTDKQTGAETLHYTIEVESKTNPLEFKEASKRADTKRSGFFKQRKSGNIVLVEAVAAKTDPQTGKVTNRVRLTTPQRRSTIIEESELNEKYNGVQAGNAIDWWNAKVKEVPATVKEQKHIIGGAILPLWSRLKTQNVTKLKVVRVTTDNKKRIVGILIPDESIGTVLRAIGVSRSFRDAVDIFKAVYKQGEEVRLVGGMSLKRTRLHGDDAIELTNVPSTKFSEIRKFGLFDESIDWKKRFFVSTDPEQGHDVIGNIIKVYPPMGNEPLPPPLPKSGRDYFADISEEPTPSLTETLAENSQMPESKGENKQIYTPELKKWFGDWENDAENASKVVNKQGKPLVVYHGTNTDFKSFSAAAIGNNLDAEQKSGAWGRGFYFTDNKKSASKYADKINGTVIPAFISLKNPLILDWKNSRPSEWSSDAKQFRGMAGINEDTNKATDWAISQGYDGIIIRDNSDFDEIVVFEPTQIKSAIGNRGTFSPIEPSILADISEEPTENGEKFSFPEEIEKRWKQSHGVKPISIFAKIADLAQQFRNQLTREFEHLPRTGEFSRLRFDLSKLQKQKPVASSKAVEALTSITDKLSKEEYDLFERLLILNDLNHEAEAGHNLPFGFTPESLRAEHRRLLAAVGGRKAIVDAFRRRNEIWNQLKADYIAEMSAIGLNVDSRFNKEDYFRHQVLAYANMKGLTGTGNKLRTPAHRGFLKKRGGSSYDINSNYLQAEFEVVSQMLYDIEVAKTISSVDANYNIAGELKEQAKEQSESSPTPVDWHDLIPEGYRRWQPREGNVFYLSDSIPARLADELRLGALEKLGITKDDLRRVPAVGGPRKEFVVKNEVADTLDNLLGETKTTAAEKFVKASLDKWKVWTLLSPRRLLKYNARNLVGDADVIFAGNPSAFKKMPQAIKELTGYLFRNAMPSDNLQRWIEYGGMQANLQVTELHEIDKLKQFDKFIDQNGGISKIPEKVFKGYWEGVRLLTDMRESILRYAAFLDYIDQIRANRGRPRNYGASIPEEVTALRNPYDRAYKLSNELLGAYDQVSVFGQYLRNHIFPFWSFKEVNFRRYIRMAKNAANDGRLSEAVGRKLLGTLAKSPYIAMRVGSFAIKATAMSAALHTVNMLFFRDEEDDLPENVKARPHIIFGRDKDGKVLYFDRLGSLGDFLQWFGLDDALDKVIDFLLGRRDLKEIAIEMAKSPVNVVVQGVRPEMKLPAELAAGKSSFPDVFRLGIVRDRGLHLARALGLENEYTAVAGLPSRGYANSFELMLYYKSDPGESAYYSTLNEKIRYLKKIGKFRSFGGDPFDGRSSALYNFKLSVRYGDKDAAEKYLAEYAALGGTKQGLATSIRNLEPLSGLNAEDERRFRNSLNADDKENLAAAIKFYEDVLSDRATVETAKRGLPNVKRKSRNPVPAPVE